MDKKPTSDIFCRSSGNDGVQIFSVGGSPSIRINRRRPDASNVYPYGSNYPERNNTKTTKTTITGYETDPTTEDVPKRTQPNINECGDVDYEANYEEEARYEDQQHPPYDEARYEDETRHDDEEIEGAAMSPHAQAQTHPQTHPQMHPQAQPQMQKQDRTEEKVVAQQSYMTRNILTGEGVEMPENRNGKRRQKKQRSIWTW